MSSSRLLKAIILMILNVDKFTITMVANCQKIVKNIQPSELYCSCITQINMKHIEKRSTNEACRGSWRHVLYGHSVFRPIKRTRGYYTRVEVPLECRHNMCKNK